MSARKARPVVDLVRGEDANTAMETLLYMNRRAAPLLNKVIKSAVASAAQEGGVEAKDLFIRTLRVNEGPLKQRRLRWRPGPMGRAMPIRKRTCHIEVILGVRGEVEKPDAPSGRVKKAAGGDAPAKGASESKPESAAGKTTKKTTKKAAKKAAKKTTKKVDEKKGATKKKVARQATKKTAKKTTKKAGGGKEGKKG